MKPAELHDKCSAIHLARNAALNLPAQDALDQINRLLDEALTAVTEAALQIEIDQQCITDARNTLEGWREKLTLLGGRQAE